MENTVETEQNQAEPPKKHGFWGWCAAAFRWFLIGLLAIALGQFLYLVFALDFSFDSMWVAFGAALAVECFLVFSTARLRQCLARKFGWFLKGAGKVSVFLIRWLFILLFAVILLGGLYFKAPWKVLVLDAVLLALLTIVPKKKRKYGWLALCVVLLALTVWVFIPDKNTGNWRPYTLDKEIKAFNDKYTVPDDKNAAIIYKQISEIIDIPKERDKFWKWDPEDKTLHGEWKKVEFPEIANWLTENQKIMASLKQASSKPFCRIPYHFNTWSFQDNELRNNLRFLSRTLLRYSNCESINIDEKIDSQIAAYRLGAHLEDTNQMIYVLSGFAVKTEALNELKKTILYSNITDQQNSHIYNTIEKGRFDWQRRFPDILDYNKLLSENNQCSLLYEEDTNNEIRLTRHNNLLSLISPEDKETFSDNILEVSKAYRYPSCIKLRLFMGWLFSVPSSEKLKSTIDYTYKPAYQMTDASFDWTKTPEGFKWNEVELNYRFLQKIYLWEWISTVYDVHDRYLRDSCQEQGVQVILALKKYRQLHNTWPDSLNVIKYLCKCSLLDSVNGQDFVYKKMNDDFILYTKGPNGIDEQGKRETFVSQEELKRLFNSKDDNKLKHVNMELKADDILIWPEKLEDSN